MKRLLILAALAMTVSPAQASSAFVLAGSAQFGDSACVEVAVAAVPAANRFRATGIYSEAGSTANAAGVCPETDEHVDLEIICVGAEGSNAYVGATRSRTSWYVINVHDSGSGDAVGVAIVTTLPSGPTCGAADVPTVPVTAGGFTIAAA